MISAIGIGLITGLLSGLLGVGGGVIMVPLMAVVLGIEQHLAQGISMLVIIPTSLVGIWQLHRKRMVDYRSAALFAGGAIIGTILSSNFVQYLPGADLKKIFGVFMIYSGIRMVIGKKRPQILPTTEKGS